MWAELPICKLAPDENEWSAALTTALGTGERTCIAIAYFHQGVFASDDLRARTAAQELSIPVVGSVGALILGIRRKLVTLSAAQELLDVMIAFGSYSPVNSLSSFFDR